jgi:hypothetical protein
MPAMAIKLAIRVTAADMVAAIQPWRIGSVIRSGTSMVALEGGSAMEDCGLW